MSPSSALPLASMILAILLLVMLLGRYDFKIAAA